MVDSDIIVAVATAEGRGGIGVVRLSGVGLTKLASALLNVSLLARRATLADFIGAGGEVIDRGIAVYFPAPHSYTGQDVLELQGHGSPVALRMLVRRCTELGARIAEPGEFTKRAFLNDKLDLAQAEAVADLVDASTERAARSAMHSLQGAFSRRIDELVRKLIDLRVGVEAGLDFPDEDVDILTGGDIVTGIEGLCRALTTILESSRRGSLLREGIRVVLAGPPNVGKSSLLNQLAGEDLAIVTPLPGTTRDVIRASLDLGGIPMHFVDTAGLRAADDPVEQIGIRRAGEALARADLVISIADASAREGSVEDSLAGWVDPSTPRIRVMNKIDLAGQQPAIARDGGTTTVWLSALTGMGIDLLHEAILEAVGWRDEGEGVFMARARHIEALERAKISLDCAVRSGNAIELLAEDLKVAQEALGAITGQFSSDALLGEIFSRFCIGK